MKEALPLDGLGETLFPAVPAADAARAVTNLIALGSVARKSPSEPGLLPCRIHSFYRGLPGLWICMDPNCSALPEARTREASVESFTVNRSMPVSAALAS